MTRRAELDETREQITSPFLRLCNSVMDHGGVAASAAELRECRGIGQQANPVLHIKNTYGGWYIVHMCNT